MKLLQRIILSALALVATLIVAAIAYINYQAMIGANPFQ